MCILYGNEVDLFKSVPDLWSMEFKLFFLSLVSVENLSLQYVNSMNCIEIYAVGLSGGGWLYGWPKMHSKSGLSLALQ